MLFIPFVAIISLSGYMALFLPALFSILIHELGHILTACLSGKRKFVLKVLPVGFAALVEEGSCSRVQRILIYTSGPLINLVFFIVFTILCNYYYCFSDIIKRCALINLYLAIFNMLPVYPFDGSKITRELLAEYFGFRIGNRYLKIISILLSVVVTISGLLLVSVNIQGFNLLLVGAYIFFFIKNDFGLEALFMSIKDMVFRHSRLLKKGMYPVRDLVVLESMRLNSVIKCMDFDRFHIIYVLGKELNIKKIYTEKEIIDYIARYGGELTFCEVVDKKGATE